MTALVQLHNEATWDFCMFSIISSDFSRCVVQRKLLRSIIRSEMCYIETWLLETWMQESKLVLHTRRQRHTSGAKTQMQWVGEVKKRKCLSVFNRLHGHKPCGHSCSHTCLLFLSSPPVCVNDSLTLERKVIKAEFHFEFHSQSVDLLHRNPLCALSNSLSLTFIQ